MEQDLLDYAETDLFDQDLKNELRTMKKLVYALLQDNERCRNDDRFLVFKVLEYKGLDIVFDEVNQMIKWHIPFDRIFEVPSFETITRVRREIQNKRGLFLPTDPSICILRKIKEDIMRSYYGHDNKFMQEWDRLAFGVK